MLSLVHSERCFSDLRLDELLAGEATSAEKRSIDAHLAQCGACRARLSELERERQVFRDELPERGLMPQGSPRREPGAAARRRWRLTGLGGAALLATAATAVWLALPRALPLADPGPERIKGSAHLGFLVVHRGSARVGATGEAVAAGDTLVFTVSSPAPAYVAILSRDGAGRASIYYPTGSDTAVWVGAGRAVTLSPATLLDATPGTEHLYGLFCRTAVGVGELRAVLASRGELSIPPGCVADGLTIEKVR